jgi:glycosyltransferase involved in cell wall biosynthesis
MNIGFEAKRFFTNYTGLGNYSRFVIDALSQRYPKNHFYLFSPRVVDHIENRSILSRKNISVVAPTGLYSKPLLSALWRTWGVSKNSSIKDLNIFHGLSQELPIGLPDQVKKVVTVHDLIFLRYPQFYNAVDVAIYHRKVRLACEKADKIIAISHQTADDVRHFLKPSNASKIEVVYQGCHPIFKLEGNSSQAASVKKKYGLPDKFILNVGTVEERKNLMVVVKALSRLSPSERLPLVVVGRHTEYYGKVLEEIRNAGLTSRIHFLNNVDFHDLPAIYRQAHLFVYPSLFEGFGIPLIEAITCNVPVITSTGSCFSEAAGAGAMYVSPADVDAMANAIRTLIVDESMRNAMVLSGRKHIQQFEPSVVADRLNDVYQALVPERATV